MKKTEAFRRSFEYLQSLDVSKTEDPVYLAGYFSECIRTFEMAWKAMQEIMVEREMDFRRGAPRPVLRAAARHGFIENFEAWERMYDLRNSGVHTYNSEVAQDLMDALPEVLRAFEDFRQTLIKIGKIREPLEPAGPPSGA